MGNLCKWNDFFNFHEKIASYQKSFIIEKHDNVELYDLEGNMEVNS